MRLDVPKAGAHLPRAPCPHTARAACRGSGQFAEVHYGRSKRRSVFQEHPRTTLNDRLRPPPWHHAAALERQWIGRRQALGAMAGQYLARHVLDQPTTKRRLESSHGRPRGPRRWSAVTRVSLTSRPSLSGIPEARTCATPGPRVGRSSSSSSTASRRRRPGTQVGDLRRGQRARAVALEEQEQPRGLLQLLHRVRGGRQVGARDDRSVVGEQES
jgi:hypothetical protein